MTTSRDTNRTGTPKASIERLEGRRLLASTLAEVRELAAAADRSVEGGFQATINFQPATMGNVDNTRADFGRPYGERGNGLTYGWNRDLEAAGDVFDRDSDRDLFSLTESPDVGNGPDGEDQTVDERYDTGVSVVGGDAWSIDVPDDRTYALAVVIGDPDFTGGESETFIDVNGTRFLRGDLVSDWPFAETVGYVQPGDDGRITIDVGPRTVDGSVLWVRVAEVEPLPTYGEGADIDWTMLNGQAAADANVPLSPVVRAEGNADRLGDELVLIGGFEQAYEGVSDRVDVLNVATGEVRSAESIPDGLPETHAASAADEARGLIYRAGGQIGLGEQGDPNAVIDDVWALDINATGDEAWTRLPDLPEPRTAASAFVVDDRLHVLGGANDLRVLAMTQHWSIDLVELIDNNNDQTEWEAMPPLPFAVNHASVELFPEAAEFGGPLAVVTLGEYDHGLGYSTVRHTQRYDVDQASWSLGQLAPHPRSHINTTVADGRIFVVGGQGPGNFVEDEVFSYDPLADEWLTHPMMPQPRKIGGLTFDNDRGQLLYVAGDSRDDGFMLDVLAGDLAEIELD